MTAGGHGDEQTLDRCRLAMNHPLQLGLHGTADVAHFGGYFAITHSRCPLRISPAARPMSSRSRSLTPLVPRNFSIIDCSAAEYFFPPALFAKDSTSPLRLILSTLLQWVWVNVWRSFWVFNSAASLRAAAA